MINVFAGKLYSISALMCVQFNRATFECKLMMQIGALQKQQLFFVQFQELPTLRGAWWSGRCCIFKKMHCWCASDAKQRDTTARKQQLARNWPARRGANLEFAVHCHFLILFVNKEADCWKKSYRIETANPFKFSEIICAINKIKCNLWNVRGHDL